MQVSVEKSGDLERKLTIQVPGEELQKKIDARLRELGKQVKIKGFRPGRIPFKVLRQRYGQSVQQEIVAQAVQSSLVEAIEKERLRPASSPVLDGAPNMDPGGDLTYTASIEVYPEVGKIDASDISVVRPQVEVTDEDVEDMLQTLREQRQTWVELQQKPARGHQATIEYVAETDAGRVPAEGRQRLAVVMGESGFDKLEKALAEMTPGDAKSLKLKFPEDYGDPQLAGRKATVDLTLVSVQERNLPEIDEEFIRSFSIESGAIEDLRKEVRGNLERELSQATTTYLKLQLVKRLLDLRADLNVPESMVREEASSLARSTAARQGREPDLDRLEPFMEPARRRVRSGLLLAEVARQNNIMIDGVRVRKTIETIAETYEQPREVVQLYYNDQRLLKAVENSVLEEQVVDWVLGEAEVKDKPMSFKEVINAAATAGQAS
jgi:trigger factor